VVGVKACLITGSLLPWTGGPVRSVAAFQRALDADVVSFTDERYVGDDALPANRSRRVNVPSIPIPCARHFLVRRWLGCGMRTAWWQTLTWCRVILFISFIHFGSLP
jgi:hypothetical protein